MKSNRNIDISVQNYFRIYIKGILIACIVALLLFMVLSLLIRYTSISESIIPAGVMMVLCISIVISGIYTGTNLRTKGWLKGALIGFIFIGLIFLGSCILNKEIVFRLSFLYKVFIGGVAGGIGGIIGINLK